MNMRHIRTCENIAADSHSVRCALRVFQRIAAEHADKLYAAGDSVVSAAYWQTIADDLESLEQHLEQLVREVQDGNY